MRTRLVRPAFWHDQTMAELPNATRLTYIGLWCVADDAGYLDWRPREIGADLYPFMAPRARDRQVEVDLGRLVEAGRIQLLECGRHALIPTLPSHGVMGGTRSEPVRKAHEKDLAERMYHSSRKSGDSPEKSYSQEKDDRTTFPGKVVSDSLSRSDSRSLSGGSRRGVNGSENPTKRTTGLSHVSALLPAVAKARP